MLYVLLLIGILMVTDFLAGAAKVAAGIQNEVSPASEIVGAIIVDYQQNSINLIYTLVSTNWNVDNLTIISAEFIYQFLTEFTQVS